MDQKESEPTRTNSKVFVRVRFRTLVVAIAIVSTLFAAIVYWPTGVVDRIHEVGSSDLLLEENRLSEIDLLIEAHSRGSAQVKIESGATLYRCVGSASIEKDVGGDDLPDRILLPGDNALTIKMTRYDREFVAGISDFPSYGTSVGFDDIDADGNLDAWCADPGDGIVRVFYGTGLGGFKKKEHISGLPGCSKAALMDFDLDGDLDIVAKMIPENYGIGGSDSKINYYWIELEGKRLRDER